MRSSTLMPRYTRRPGGGDPLTVLHVVAVDVADLGDADRDAGAVAVAQAPLEVGMGVRLELIQLDWLNFSLMSWM